ncbi:hypothetical protein EHS25_000442 [Saitozyma podzolica]|uniref:Uncharacterized protein n=1 Tax=Saitozyma podzolica TaxID=1890683 RepID=A0A427YWG2_9TREE|nr:hypothetical protein EHS25_000442 [Saitozyma podzolica]
MSLRTISLSALPLARANAANAARTLSTTAVYRKSVVDQVKDAAQTVNKKVGQTLASGIESAETTTSQAKETVQEPHEISSTWQSVREIAPLLLPLIIPTRQATRTPRQISRPHLGVSPRSSSWSLPDPTLDILPLARSNPALVPRPFSRQHREKTPSESDVKKTAESARQNVNHSLGQAAGKARDVKDDVKKQL